MKRAVLISVYCFHILSLTGLLELTRMPVLIQHFFEHKSLDERITFIDYLEHHYSDIPHTDDDEDRDNQLPFKATEVLASSLISSALPPSFEVIPKKASQILTPRTIPINNHPISGLSFAGKIWQPPKSILS